MMQITVFYKKLSHEERGLIKIDAFDEFLWAITDKLIIIFLWALLQIFFQI